MTTNARPHTHLPGRLKIAVRAAWLILVGLLLATFAAGVPVRLSNLLKLASNEDPPIFVGLPPALEAVVFSRLGPEEAQALQTFGLSRGFYAGYILAFDVALVLACAVIGLLIFWRRSDDWIALWVSLVLVLVGTNGVSLVVPSLVAVWSGVVLVSTVAGFLGMISMVHILFLSPDGRFVPRWTLTLAAGSTGGIAALGLLSIVESWRAQTMTAFITVVVPITLVVFTMWVGGLGLGVLNQIYRYQRVSGPVQRQQTKWLIVGLASVVLGIVLNVFFLFVSSQQFSLPRLLSYLIRAPLVNLCMLLLPVCLGFSIFRYRLWDIDLVIRRTLVYSVLSSLLALTYFSLIVVLQSVFAAFGGQRSEAVTVLSTLAIAALFFPLRNRVQDFIDRRFFRKKYDAQKVLAEFAATARDETDLEKLTARLVEVVDETMQPESVSVWLRGSEPLKHREH